MIVPLIDNAEDAAAAVRAARYPPVGVRSYGPMRSQLRVGPTPAEADESVLVLAMIETPEGLDNVAEICATPGVDGVYVGPSDLRLAVGGATSTDPAVDEAFEQAVEKIAKAAEAAGIAAGIHTPAGDDRQQAAGAGLHLRDGCLRPRAPGAGGQVAPEGRAR